MRLKYSLLPILTLLIFSSSNLRAAEGFPWKYSVTPQGLRAASVDSLGEGAGKGFYSQLKIQCREGEGGTIGILYYVVDPKKFSFFKFDDFEGPDAPALAKKPLTLQVVGPDKVWWQQRLTLTGYYQDQNFIFELSASNTGKSKIRDALAQLLKGPSYLAVEIQDLREKNIFLKTVFPTQDAVLAVKQVLEGCAR